MNDVQKFYDALAEKLGGNKWVELTRNQQDAIVQAVQIIIAVNQGMIQ